MVEMKVVLYDVTKDLDQKIVVSYDETRILDSYIVTNPVATDINKLEYLEGSFVFPNYVMVVNTDRDVNTITDDEKLNFFKFLNIKKMGAYCAKEIELGFRSSNTHTYEFELFDQINFIQKYIVLLQERVLQLENRMAEFEATGKPSTLPPLQIDPFYWKTTDAGLVLHTYNDFLQVAKDAENYKISVLQKFWTLEQRILNATSYDEVKQLSVWEWS